MGFIIWGFIWDIPTLIFAYVLFWGPTHESFGGFGVQSLALGDPSFGWLLVSASKFPAIMIFITMSAIRLLLGALKPQPLNRIKTHTSASPGLSMYPSKPQSLQKHTCRYIET